MPTQTPTAPELNPAELQLAAAAPMQDDAPPPVAPDIL